MVTAAMALFGLIDNFMRLAAEAGGLWQFHFLRGVLAVAILVPVALVLGLRLRPAAPGRVALRSCLNALAMVLYFGALGVMPIAQAVAGLFTAPIWVVILSAAVFGDRIGPRRIAAVAIGFAGALLALRPEAGGFTPASLVPVLAGALYGAGNLVTRRLCAAEGTATLLTGFFALMAVWGALGCLALALWPMPVAEGAAGWATRGWVAPEGAFLVMIVVQAVGSLAGVGLTIRAYQMADATMVAVMENMLLVAATLWAIALWGEVPDAAGWAGLGLILVAGVIVARPGGAAPSAPPAAAEGRGR
jgi:drug/metabolite transporter (DMT)-like permease